MSNAIMTPAEARIAAMPTVGEYTDKINAGLAKGERILLVPVGIGQEIRVAMRDRGWKIIRDQENDNGWLVLSVREETSDQENAHSIPLPAPGTIREMSPAEAAIFKNALRDGKRDMLNELDAWFADTVLDADKLVEWIATQRATLAT